MALSQPGWASNAWGYSGTCFYWSKPSASPVSVMCWQWSPRRVVSQTTLCLGRVWELFNLCCFYFIAKLCSRQLQLEATSVSPSQRQPRNENTSFTRLFRAKKKRESFFFLDKTTSSQDSSFLRSHGHKHNLVLLRNIWALFLCTPVINWKFIHFTNLP